MDCPRTLAAVALAASLAAGLVWHGWCRPVPAAPFTPEALAARLGWRWVPDPLDGGGGGWLCREPQPLDVLRHYQAPQDADGRRHGSPPGVVYCVPSMVRYGEEGWTLTGDPEMIPVLADR